MYANIPTKSTVFTFRNKLYAIAVRTEQPGNVTCLPWTAPYMREHSS